MTVKELIKRLEDNNLDLDIEFYNNENNCEMTIDVLTPDYGNNILEISFEEIE